MNLTKSQKIVLRIVKENKGGITPSQLLEEIEYAPRTVRYALRKLMKLNLVKRVLNLKDTRKHIYYPV